MRQPVLHGRSARGFWAGLVVRGLTRGEAGNIVAHSMGLSPLASGWTITELEHIAFYRLLVKQGRIGGRNG